MKKNVKNKVRCILILLIIFVILLPNFSIFIKRTYADGPGTVPAGTGIKIPADLPQYGAQIEDYDKTWNSTSWQYKLNKLWNEAGKPTDPETNWVYLEVNGVKRYFVALTTVFGWSGDFVDIVLQDGTVYPCIIGDAKGITKESNDGADTNTVGGAYIDSNGVHWGHCYESNGNLACDIVEIIIKNYSLQPDTSLLNKFNKVAEIRNGGSIFTNPDGPIGLNGYYDFGNSSNGNNQNVVDDETDTFQGMAGSFFRNIWVIGETKFQNYKGNRNDSTVLYSFKKVIYNGRILGLGNGDILGSCATVTQMLMERGCRYPSSDGHIDYSKLDYTRDIDKQLRENNWFCCATYVAAVLYYSGALTAEQINAYNYHYTGSGGIPDMLAAAGWKKLPPSEAQPGDVINKNGVHVLIYAGDGKCWDQSSAVTSSSGTPPTGKVKNFDISSYDVWRAP